MKERNRKYRLCCGAASISLALLLALASPLESQVRLLSWTESSFRAETGGFAVWYDSAATGGAMFIARTETAQVVLTNLLCGGPGLEPLQPGVFSRLEVSENAEAIRVSVAATPTWGELRSTVELYKDAPGLIHWRVEGKARSDFSPWRQRRALSFYDRAARVQVSGSLETYATQAPWAAGVAYFSEKRYLDATLLFFENFTALNRYFETVGAGPENAIYLSNKQFGYVRPVNAGKYLPKNEWIVLEDSYLVLQPGLPEQAQEVGLRFLRGLAWVLRTLERPWAGLQPDWLQIAKRTVHDLEDPSCWVELDGRKYLRAYVNVPRFSCAEAIAQLDVLCPLTALETALDDRTFWTFDDLHLIPNLVTFLQPTYRVFVNDYPPGGVTGLNGWYQLQLLIDLAELARGGNPAAPTARMLLKQSLPVVVELARANGYRFYEGFRYSDYSVWGKLEADATGGYAYLMLDAAEIFGDSTYLDEARAALVALPLDQGFDFTYEAHFSAITAAACARLAARTGDPSWVERAYLPLASLFRIVWWWECDYGWASSYQTFGGLSPMIGAGVITPKEQYEAWWYLREFLGYLGDGVEIPDELEYVVSLFLDESPRVCYFCLPPNLPREAVWTQPTIYNSVNNPDLMIPLEDLRQGWDRSGKYGQEIYGAGMSLAFAAAQVATGVVGPARKSGCPQNHELSIWPNPAKGDFRLQIRSARAARATVWLFNELGQQIAGPIQVPTNRAVYFLELVGGTPLASGLYFVVVETDGKRLAERALLMR